MNAVDQSARHHQVSGRHCVSGSATGTEKDPALKGEPLVAPRIHRHGCPGGRQPYAAACSVMSEISVRLSPLVVPKVVIHTSTFDVLVRSFTAMRLCPC